ncbi:hypothetical protein IFM89_029395 [Coptis chinensis]|uniref:Phylloplanin n=1 Tax=Coptis chinensis TaxID=261450 RepID=A0A835IQ78_9MAGN|nr:hypothetical protein IFM89_029395 [Coptis chinensis]
MVLKYLLFVSLLVVGSAAPLAKPQLETAPLAKAQLDTISFGALIVIQGTLLCSTNGTTCVNGTATPFPNALVQLQCGIGTAIASATTTPFGSFSIFLNGNQITVATLLSNCRLLVTTPLSTCNSALPAGGTLASRLTFVGETVSGILPFLRISIFIATAFNITIF